MKKIEKKTGESSRENDLFAEDWDRRSKSSVPEKKKNIILPSIVFTLALVLCSLLGILYLSHDDGSIALEQLARAESLQHEDYVAFIESVPKPDTWGDELYSKLRSEALEAYDTTRMDQIDAALDGDETAREALKDVDTASEQPGLAGWKRLFENVPLYPGEILEYVAANPSNSMILADYPEKVSQNPVDAPLNEDLSVLPDLKNADERWAFVPYSGSLMMLKGSAPVAVSEVFSYLLKDPSVTPIAVAAHAAQYGYDSQPLGSDASGSLFSSAAVQYGVSMNPLPAYKTQITEAVELNDLVIAALGSQENPQFLVIHGIDENGNWLVSDPASTEPSSSVDPDTIKDSLIAAYAFWVE